MKLSVPRPRQRTRRRMLAAAIGLSFVLPPAVAASEPRHGISAARGSNPAVTYYSLTKKTRSPFWITPGPDGNMWFTNPDGDTIGKITPKGVVTEYQLAKGTRPQTITAAADGNLWFTMRSRDKIGVMDIDGNLLHQYSVEVSDAVPYSIAPSPDGAVWFTDYAFESADVLDKVDLSDCACAPLGATYGPDGNMWFTEELGATPEMEGGAYGTVDRVSLDGKTIDRFPISTTQTVLPQYLAPGPDGNVWFTEVAADRHNLGRVTPEGTVTEFHIADTFASTNVVTTGADGDLWFTEAGTSSGDVWRMHPNGALVGTSIPVHFNPVGIALGPDGNLWFTSREDGEIGRIDVSPPGRPVVLEIASGFAPGLRTIALGALVQWVLEAPGMHRVRDASGMGLFSFSAAPPVSFQTFRFTAAGTYPYSDPAGGRQGKIAVKLVAPATVHAGSSHRISWATLAAPDGALFDVEIQRPGEDGFGPFRTATTAHGAPFTPAHAGAYRFRSRMRLPGGGGTGFSPVATIHVS